MSTPVPAESRPRPIVAAFRSIGAKIAALGTLFTALVSLGVINAAQGTALEHLAAGVPGFLELVVMVLVAFGVIKRAEASTTSTKDPATVVNGQLVALRPDPEQLAVALAERSRPVS